MCANFSVYQLGTQRLNQIIMADNGGGGFAIRNVTKLTRTNYKSWRYEMEMVLRERFLWNIVKRKELPPDPEDEEAYNLFEARMSRAYSIIAPALAKIYET